MCGPFTISSEPVLARVGYSVGVTRWGWLILVLVLVGACDRRVEPYVPPEEEPPPPERPVRIPGLERPSPRAQTAPPPGTRSPAPPAAGPAITGSVTLASGAQGGDGVLFVIARSSAAGPPLAVKRLPAGPFPLSFEIGPGDVMIQGRPFAGPITLTARLDRDGDPLTRGNDDLAAELASPVEPGATGLELVLR